MKVDLIVKKTTHKPFFGQDYSKVALFQKDKVVAEKRRLAIEVFDGKCYICQKPYGSGFAFHHKKYDPNRKKHSDFKNTIEYNAYVIPEIISDPDRFRLLCKICHARIDQPRYGYLGHIPKDRLDRLYEVAKETIPGPKKTRKKGGESTPESPTKQ